MKPRSNGRKKATALPEDGSFNPSRKISKSTRVLQLTFEPRVTRRSGATVLPGTNAELAPNHPTTLIPTVVASRSAAAPTTKSPVIAVAPTLPVPVPSGISTMSTSATHLTVPSASLVANAVPVTSTFKATKLTRKKAAKASPKRSRKLVAPIAASSPAKVQAMTRTVAIQPKPARPIVGARDELYTYSDEGDMISEDSVNPQKEGPKCTPPNGAIEDEVDDSATNIYAEENSFQRRRTEDIIAAWRRPLDLAAEDVIAFAPPRPTAPKKKTKAASGAGSDRNVAETSTQF